MRHSSIVRYIAPFALTILQIPALVESLFPISTQPSTDEQLFGATRANLDENDKPLVTECKGTGELTPRIISREGSCLTPVEEAIVKVACGIQCSREPCLMNCITSPKDIRIVDDDVLGYVSEFICRDNSSVVLRHEFGNFVIERGEINEDGNEEWYGAVTNYGSEVMLSDLSPGKSYRWRIYPVEANLVWKSRTTKWIQTMPADQYEPIRITNVTMGKFELDSIDSTYPGWKLKINFTSTEDLPSFPVTCQQEDTGYSWTSDSTRVVTDDNQWKGYSVTFRSLPFGANFTVNVTVPTLPCRLRATHQETILAFSTPRCVYSLPHPRDCLPEPVKDLNATATYKVGNIFDVWVTWVPPNELPDVYIVDLHPIGVERLNPVSKTVPKDNVDTIFSNVKMLEEFEVNVRASNKFGNVSKTSRSFTVPQTPVDGIVPSPVRDLVAVIVNETSGEFEVSWIPDNSSTQDSYVLSYDEVERLTDDRLTYLFVNTTEVILEALLPGRNYSVSVRAISDKQESEESVIYVVTRPATPIFDGLKSIEKDLIVYWKSDVNSRQEKFEATYNTFTIQETGESMTASTTEFHIHLEDLFPGAPYEIQVVAISHGLSSDPMYCSGAVRPHPPTNFSIEEVTGNGVLISWEPQRDSLCTSLDIVYESEDDEHHAWFRHSCDLASTRVSATISDLEPGVRYTIKIITYSNSVESLESPQVTQTIPPSPVRDIVATSDSTKVTLEWPRPAEGRIETYVIRWWPVENTTDIHTKNVTESYVSVFNLTDYVRMRKELISDLIPDVEYSFSIDTVSYNSVSDVTNLTTRTMKDFIERATVEGLNATTTHKVGKTFDIHVVWDTPKLFPDYYLVNVSFESSKAHNPVFHNVSGSTNETIFPDVEISEEFTVSVTAWSSFGERVVTAELFQSPEIPVQQKDILVPMCLILGTLAVIGVGVAVYGYSRFRKRGPTESGQADQFELSPRRLDITRVLGNGAFGVVKLGSLSDDRNHVTTVAVKMLKDESNETELRNFLLEIQFMKTLDKHPNLVSLVGCCTTGPYPFLVVEYCARGDLHSFLRKLVEEETVDEPKKPAVLSRRFHSRKEIFQENSNGSSTTRPGENYVQVASLPEDQDTNFDADAVVTLKDMLNFGRQIATGMEFLSSNRVVHRDLAARNVLVSDDLTVKISDFGLSRDVYEEDIYQKRGNGRMPLKWMAIEALTHQVYTTYSDVWSFGVLLWEIATLGGSPYPGIPTIEILKRLQLGYRMERPANCSIPLSLGSSLVYAYGATGLKLNSDLLAYDVMPLMPNFIPFFVQKRHSRRSRIAPQKTEEMDRKRRRREESPDEDKENRRRKRAKHHHKGKKKRRERKRRHRRRYTSSDSEESSVSRASEGGSRTPMMDRSSSNENVITTIAEVHPPPLAETVRTGEDLAQDIEVIPPAIEVALGEEILKAIGKRLTTEKVLGPAIHNDLVSRWKDIFDKGLPKDEKDELFKKHPQPENCGFVAAPKLNMEVRAALQEPVVSRDERMAVKQDSVAVSLSILATVLASLLSNPTEHNIQMLEKLSDACRLLVDIQRTESQTRRTLILANIKGSIKDTLAATTPDEWLFGANLDEKIKAAKLLERSSKDLQGQLKAPASRVPKNYKTPPFRQWNNKQPARSTGGRPRWQAPRHTQQNSSSSHKRSTHRK